MSLTKILNNRILTSIGFSVNANNYHACYYDGFINKEMDCYSKIEEYHILQFGNDEILTKILEHSPFAPLYTKIYSDNNVLFTVSVNNKILCTLGELDLNLLFKEEIRDFNLNYLFSF